MKKLNKYNDIYDSVITIDNIKKTWNIVRKTCKNRKAVYKFYINQNINISNIYCLLKQKKYNPSKYRVFMIFEPKPRLVMSQSIVDKIVNHFVTNYYLIPYLENKLVECNVATRKNKGSSYALYLFEKYVNTLRLKNENIYCLKIDISKYFYTIDHEILIEKIKKYIEDEDVITLLERIIGETNNGYVNELIEKYNLKYNTIIPFYKENVGLSIGAMTSQFFAIYYLNDLDHFIKENLHCKHYIRYMDDFVILETSEEKLNSIFNIISKEIEKLKLAVNPKSYIYDLKDGVTFLGYKYKIVNKKLKIFYNKKTYKKVNKKLNKLKKNNLSKYYKTYRSYYGYLKKVYPVERNFVMKSKDKYEYYKKIKPKNIVLIKEGSFYKTYGDDAIILWHIFGYKWNNDSISFGSTPYIKVINKLSNLGLGYCIIKDDELFIDNDEKVYDLYLSLARINYDKEKQNEELHFILDEVLLNKRNVYAKIKDFLIEMRGDISEAK